MLLPNSLDQRIADAITSRPDGERQCVDLTLPTWRARSVVAKIAMLAHGQCHAAPSHIASRRGEWAASSLAQSASEVRTLAIFFRARAS
jgi:hypothetical protein